MPLFLCPNDDSHMQKITRDGVELDVCPTCKGVWLDRGELDKLLNIQREDAESRNASQQRFQKNVEDFQRDPDDWRKRHPYDEERKQHRYDDDDDDRRRRKRRGFDLSDIFDF